jgi:drug/metabolite transporter (DMT)-like permease
MLALALGVAFVLAYLLRDKRTAGPLAIPLAALLVPPEITIETFVYPASPESQMWWRIAVVVGFVYGLIAAGFGYVCAAVIQKRRGPDRAVNADAPRARLRQRRGPPGYLGSLGLFPMAGSC